MHIASARRENSALRGKRIGDVFARGAAGAMGVKVAGAAAALVAQFALARLMTPVDYGVYSWAISWLTTLAMFTRVGADMAFLRYLPGYVAAGEWSLFRGLLQWGSRVSLVASSIVALGGLGLLLSRRTLTSSETWALSIALLLTPVFSLSFLRQGALRALKRVVLAELPETVLRFLFVSIAVAAVSLATQERVSAVAAMCGTVAAFAASYAVGHVWLVRSLPPEVRAAIPEGRGAEWLRTSLPLLVATSMAMVINQAGIIALAEFGDVEGAGVFAIVVRIAMLLGFGLMAVNSIAAPIIAELYGSRRLDELQHVLTKSARIVTLYTLTAGVVVSALGDWLLRIFGEHASAGHRALVIMVAGQLVTASMGSVSYLVGMTGHHAAGAIIAAFSAVSCVVLNAVLVPAHGMDGAATATALSLALSAGSAAVYVRLRLGLRSTPL